jgi:hypothetical protein
MGSVASLYSGAELPAAADRGLALLARQPLSAALSAYATDLTRPECWKSFKDRGDQW